MFNHTKSPVPSQWLKMSNLERTDAINKCLKEKNIDCLSIDNFNDNGHVVFKIIKNIPVNERGLFLIKFESFLKKKIDNSLTLWCSAQGDKSKLRNLRGVQIKV